ncbi:MAG: hypothetical protein QOK05_2401 [Chloroflexota bacterium]|jgi:hypothetical protein|nr:hypothetical protein [Chloroflexota bacterium]
MATRPHEVDLKTVEAILAEARHQEAEVLSPEVPPEKAITRLGKVEVEELDGSKIALGSLWEDRPAALVFLRHYG